MVFLSIFVVTWLVIWTLILIAQVDRQSRELANLKQELTHLKQRIGAGERRAKILEMER